MGILFEITRLLISHQVSMIFPRLLIYRPALLNSTFAGT